MTTPVSMVEAKARFSEYVRKAEAGKPILITRHGRAVAALVGVEDLAAVRRLRTAGPQSGLASLGGGWEGSDELAEFLAGARRRSRRSSGG